MRWSFLPLCILLPFSAHACPDLSAYYSYGDDPESQAALEAALAPLMNECLRSSEFFALYGAAQMDTGKLAEALEMLERALLLDANNGAAQIDYAQALYLRGQLFSALDLNAQILQREDIPSNIQAMLEQRGSSGGGRPGMWRCWPMCWRGMTITSTAPRTRARSR